jgi:hypothetical protein
MIAALGAFEESNKSHQKILALEKGLPLSSRAFNRKGR